MSKKFLCVCLIAISAVLFTGCRTQTVYNVQSAAIQSNGALTEAQVEKAILRAATQLGWQTSKVKDGLIVATISLRGNTAQVNIKYSATNFDISYKDSSGLKYDGVNIHQNYNGWIHRLENAIQTQIDLI